MVLSDVDTCGTCTTLAARLIQVRRSKTTKQKDLCTPTSVNSTRAFHVRTSFCPAVRQSSPCTSASRTNTTTNAATAPGSCHRGHPARSISQNRHARPPPQKSSRQPATMWWQTRLSRGTRAVQAQTDSIRGERKGETQTHHTSCVKAAAVHAPSFRAERARSAPR